MSSKYYLKFNSGNIDNSILNERVGGWSFEDHYWHLACLAKYYKTKTEEANKKEKKEAQALEKQVLSELCDMNYIFNAFYLYSTFDCLPVKYKYVIKKFENSMMDPFIEDEIKRFNKLSRKENNKKYWLSSLTSLITIPVMMFLMLVCHLDSSISIAITIIILMIVQWWTNPFMENSYLRKLLKSKIGKKKQPYIPAELNEYLKYLDRFVPIINNEYYKALLQSKDEEEAKKIAQTIKEKKINI